MSKAPGTVSVRMPAAVAVVLAIAVAATAAHGLYTVFGLGKPGLSAIFDDWVYDGVLVAGALACLLRGILVPSDRRGWLAVATGLWLWTAGDVYWNVALSNLETIPYPSPADAFYLAGYLPIYAGIAMLARTRRWGRLDIGLWLDGLLGGLAVAAIGAAFLYPAFEGSTQGNIGTVAVNLAYPLGDILLLVFVVGGVALSGWRPDRGWALLGGGLAVTAVADAIYLQQEATGGYTTGTWLDTLWPLGAIAIAGAAWTARARPSAAPDGLLRGRLVLPAVFALSGGVAIQFYDHFNRVSNLSAWLSAATLLVVIVRMTLAFEENLTLLRRSRAEALVDSLTGLGNRRRLLRDLDDVAADPAGARRMVVLFDLDGFKAYNDTFGHPAGDALLARLGHKLKAAAEPHGSAYRMGGDEFCVLADLSRVAPETLLTETSAALWETGEGFSIGSSRGSVVMPDETSEPSEAVRVADRRMYGMKNTRPRSPRRQTIDVLLRTLHEREPSLESHLHGVAHHAVALGRAFGLDADELDLVARGAELHDIGKMAVPDQILHKPGPLDEKEWEVMRKHTLIGERILESAPALLPVAKLVRSSHERWDGDGYPDAIAGEEIPLGARIIAICDSYEAMVENRPWRTPMEPAEALAELHRCEGTQFDTELVEVFARKVFPDLEAVAAEKREAVASLNGAAA